MNYTRENLKECSITNRMFLQWFMKGNTDGTYAYDENNIDLEVKFNGRVLENPLDFFKLAEAYIDEKIDNHCRVLNDFDNEIDELVEKRANEILEDKIQDLKRNIVNWLKN